MLGDIIVRPCHRSLGLTPTEVLTLAIIDGFTLNGGKGYIGGVEALAKEVGVSFDTMRNTLASLRGKGLVMSQKRSIGQTGAYLSDRVKITPSVGVKSTPSDRVKITPSIESKDRKKREKIYTMAKPTMSEIRRVYVDNKIDPAIYSPETFCEKHRDEQGNIRNDEGAIVSNWKPYLLMLYSKAKDISLRENLTHRPAISEEQRERLGQRYGVRYQTEKTGE